MIVQRNMLNQVHKLYVEQTTHTTATVEVEETGVYQVSIFPLREGTGILDSNVEYTQQVNVSSGRIPILILLLAT